MEDSISNVIDDKDCGQSSSSRSTLTFSLDTKKIILTLDGSVPHFFNNQGPIGFGL